jgi:hypothetical protein
MDEENKKIRRSVVTSGSDEAIGSDDPPENITGW